MKLNKFELCHGEKCCVKRRGYDSVEKYRNICINMFLGGVLKVT